MLIIFGKFCIVICGGCFKSKEESRIAVLSGSLIGIACEPLTKEASRGIMFIK